MGAAAGKSRELDSPTTWCDPGEDISKKHSQNPVSTTSVKPKNVTFVSRQESYPGQRVENEYRALRRRENDVKHFALVNDNTAVPVANRWREHRPVGSHNTTEQEVSKICLDTEDHALSYSRHSVVRRRFEDIPVSAMWREPPRHFSLTSHSQAPKTNQAPNTDIGLDLARRATREVMFREKEEKDEAWLHEQLAQREAEKKAALRSVNASILLTGPKVSEPTVPQDAKPGWDFSTQISYRRPVPNRSVSPLAFLPRTMSDPLRKPHHQHLQNIGRRISSEVPDPLRLIPRTNSDPVEVKPVGSRRPATPFVSGTLTTNRPLNEYILDRRRNGLGLRNSSFSCVQNKLRSISDIDEQPRRKSPALAERNSCVSKYMKP